MRNCDRREGGGRYSENRFIIIIIIIIITEETGNLGALKIARDCPLVHLVKAGSSVERWEMG